MTAERLMLAGGIGVFLLTLYLVRVRELRERYALGWLATATILLLCGLFPHVLMRISAAVNMSYASFVLLVALAVIYCYSFFVSVALSSLRRRHISLLQHVSLMDRRLKILEQQQCHVPGETVSPVQVWISDSEERKAA